jgi:hypothetical protein
VDPFCTATNRRSRRALWSIFAPALILGDKPKLSFDVGAAKGCAWHLTVFVQNDRVLDRLVEGDTPIGADSNVISWQHITLDLSKFAGETVNIRLYDLVLVPHRYAGNSYWRDIEVQ